MAKPEHPNFEFTAEVQYNLSKEIDEFEYQSRNRRMIADLLRPIIEEADIERKNQIMLTMSFTQLNERLHKMEYMFGIEKVKPTVFQNIDNRFCDLIIDMNKKFQEANESNVAGAQRNKTIMDRIADYDRALRSTDQLL